ncbi:MAG: hypothetical protein ACLR8Y_08720 [Alistipes indistinctus]
MGVFLLLGAATLTQAQDRKAAREARRQQQQQQQQVQGSEVICGRRCRHLFKDSSFVIEVNQIQGQYGKVVYVTANDKLRGFEQEHFDQCSSRSTAACRDSTVRAA